MRGADLSPLIAAPWQFSSCGAKPRRARGLGPTERATPRRGVVANKIEEDAEGDEEEDEQEEEFAAWRIVHSRRAAV